LVPLSSQATESQSRNRFIASENNLLANYLYDLLKRALNL
jgi:hypothetical protein